MNSIEPLIIDLSKLGELTDEKLLQLSSENRTLRFERTSAGQLVVMSPTASYTGFRNNRILYALSKWNELEHSGFVFDSSSGFRLPNNAVLSPDAAWIASVRWTALSRQEQESLAPICPDFIVELMSKSDSLRVAQAKMEEWMENGCKLGWLINPARQRSYIYREDGSRSIVRGFANMLSGEALLPGFELNLTELL